ncbi:MAG: gamma-glutamylcyclotransferase family protein [Segetibacter sp.]
MEINITHLFVYGSLRRRFCLPEHEYISRYFTFISEARAKGLLYDTGDYPAAVKNPKETFITGELYKAKNVGDFRLAIDQLDVYEEADTEEGIVPLYKRELTEVIYNNTIAIAWIYWYNRSIEGQTLIPSGDIMDVIEFKSKS